MPREIRVKLYTFDELSDKAKERARAWWREGEQWEWWEHTFEDAKTCLALVGFTVKDIFFSGFWSQGDGACFTGSWDARDVKPPTAMREHAPVDSDLHAIAEEFAAIAVLDMEASAILTHRGNYSHKYTIDFAFDHGDVSDAVAVTVEERVTEAARDAMQWIYRQLEKEYEWQNADEQVDEAILVNGYEFTEDGSHHV